MYTNKWSSPRHVGDQARFSMLARPFPTRFGHSFHYVSFTQLLELPGVSRGGARLSGAAADPDLLAFDLGSA